MAAIEIFKNESFGEVRVAGTSEKPLFCLADLCSVLELRPNDVRQRLDDGVVSTHPITDSLGREQQANFVNEDGMYDVILDSRKPQARAFRKWITSDVLPSIRKTGSYSVKTEDVKPTISDKMKAATWAAKFLNLNESSKLIIAKQILEPYNLPLPDYTPSKGILKSASELLSERGIEISAQVFNKKAIEKGYLCELERNSTHGQKKRFKSITNKGLSFGENQVNPNNPKSTQPLWYEDKFGELLGVLGFQLKGGLTYGK